ncbi:MAG: hypothetical protein IJO32_04520 [Bacilli bacterium]|nr:hypothetical protein [Bacilli bacterium]
MKVRGFEKISFEQFKKDFSFLENIEDAYNNIKIPVRATKYSVGYDISTPFDFEIKPGEIKLISTGLKVYFQTDEVFSMYIRSSMGFKHNIRLCNQVGIVESDYYNNEDNEGHLFIKIQNEGDKTVKFNVGDRIVQGIFSKYLVTDDDNVTNVRKSGIGSTDRKDDK